MSKLPDYLFAGMHRKPTHVVRGRLRHLKTVQHPEPERYALSYEILKDPMYDEFVMVPSRHGVPLAAEDHYVTDSLKDAEAAGQDFLAIGCTRSYRMREDARLDRLLSSMKQFTDK